MNQHRDNHSPFAPVVALNSKKDRKWDKELHSGVEQKRSRPEKSAACMGTTTSTLNRDLDEVSRLKAISATIRPKVQTMAAMILVAIHFAGCAGIGPQTINRDRFDYVSAISDSREFRVVFGSYATNRREIAIFSRSMLQIFSAYASLIEVPASHVSQKRVTATVREDLAMAAGFPPLIRVFSSLTEPEDAFVAVPYRDHFFWIDDRDIHSKSMFFFLMILFSFTERGQAEPAAPVLTVPTN